MDNAHPSPWDEIAHPLLPPLEKVHTYASTIARSVSAVTYAAKKKSPKENLYSILSFSSRPTEPAPKQISEEDWWKPVDMIKNFKHIHEKNLII